MNSYTLGLPEGQLQTANNVKEYSDIQDAANSCSYFCVVHANSLSLAVGKFMHLYDTHNPIDKLPECITVQMRSNHSIGTL